MRILHLSDIHVQVDYRSIGFRNLDWRRLLAQLEMDLFGRAAHYANAVHVVDEIGSAFNRAGADHLVLSGDLTGLAFDEEFARARAALDPYARQNVLTVVPGNHDRYTPESEREARFEHYFQDLLVSELPEFCVEGPYPFVRCLGEEVAVVGLNSARATPFPGLAYGRLGGRQLEALDAILADRRIRDRLVFVAVHHCPLRSWGGYDFPGHSLADADKLLAIVQGPKRAILSGHIHQRYWVQATSSRPHVFCAGSSTCFGEEGYWLIDVQDGLIRNAERTELGKRCPVPAYAPAPAG